MEYIYELLIFSKDSESHYKHLENVLHCLHDNELYASAKRCELFKEMIEFIAIVIGKNGFEMNPEKVKTKQTWPKPRSIIEVRSFLGILKFFRRLIP